MYACTNDPSSTAPQKKYDTITPSGNNTPTTVNSNTVIGTNTVHSINLPKDTSNIMSNNPNPVYLEFVSANTTYSGNTLISDSANKYLLTMKKTYTILALGDSYTIGEAVSEAERYPNQLATALRNLGYDINPPKIIARTGWTTSELMYGIRMANDTAKYDFVLLLIGVNNQYRGYPVSGYVPEFNALLTTALGYNGHVKEHIFVVSIPDYGYTPFGSSNRAVISAGIDTYNAANLHASTAAGVNYINITDISRRNETGLVAYDNLHPSGKQYGYWAERILPYVLAHMDK
ncbi:MAG: GDSL-type esterase/lipase family protein [Cytophagales bacterium]|nr:GDSL-type esterase/lipase family protein [Cytophagales bacterium]